MLPRTVMLLAPPRDARFPRKRRRVWAALSVLLLALPGCSACHCLLRAGEPPPRAPAAVSTLLPAGNSLLVENSLPTRESRPSGHLLDAGQRDLAGPHDAGSPEHQERCHGAARDPLAVTPHQPARAPSPAVPGTLPAPPDGTDEPGRTRTARSGNRSGGRAALTANCRWRI
ncbi:hypothetical protein [Streptomyces sp. NPDC101393]|uniref:hypothetical protein n=1 Tax=Streptomyces sp. NPDC101393 TaxID=3366141 RepID=UPI0037FA5173